MAELYQLFFKIPCRIVPAEFWWEAASRTPDLSIEFKRDF